MIHANHIRRIYIFIANLCLFAGICFFTTYYIIAMRGTRPLLALLEYIPQESDARAWPELLFSLKNVTEMDMQNLDAQPPITARILKKRIIQKALAHPEDEKYLYLICGTSGIFGFPRNGTFRYSEGEVRKLTPLVEMHNKRQKFSIEDGWLFQRLPDGFILRLPMPTIQSNTWERSTSSSVLDKIIINNIDGIPLYRMGVSLTLAPPSEKQEDSFERTVEIFFASEKDLRWNELLWVRPEFKNKSLNLGLFKEEALPKGTNEVTRIVYLRHMKLTMVLSNASEPWPPSVLNEKTLAINLHLTAIPDRTATNVFAELRP